MATPAPSTAGPPSHSSSGSRWARTGEPGSAFSGLTRGGRGSRGRGAPRGGRGGNRGGAPSREPKNDDPSRSSKDTFSAPALVNTKSTSSVASSVSSSKIDRSNPPSTNAPKPKPASRRGSRSIPPAIVTQIQTAEVPSSPQSARSPQKRRRSQVGKGNAVIPAKINPPQSNDDLVRSNRPNLGPVPHTAPVKDAPPHIGNGAAIMTVDKRSELDSFMERCRAPRAVTPGSHIDWAGDDDDSLPDLDDWGINTATFSASKSDIISPIIVDGLKPLPDLHAHLVPASPLRHVNDFEGYSTATDSLSTSLSDLKEEVDAIEFEDRTPSSSTPSIAADASATAQGPIPSILDSTPTHDSRPATKPIHPSLPAKPNAAPVVAHLNLRPGATPMRKNYTKTPHSANKEGFNLKESKPILPEPPASAPVGSEPLSTPTLDGAATPTLNSSAPKEVSVPLAVVVPPTPVDKGTVETPKADAGHKIPARPQTAIEKVLDSIEATGGLETSIHAPKAISDSRSAPAHMSSYPDIAATPASADSRTTQNGHHQRSHTVGRPYNNNRRHNGDRSPQINRNPNFTNGGLNDSHGGFSNGHHSRTQSSPPVAAGGTSPHARPRITGDAISRLVRTINKGNNTSPPKPAPSVGLNN